jgi:hypothetical protein
MDDRHPAMSGRPHADVRAAFDHLRANRVPTHATNVIIEVSIFRGHL